MKVGSLQENKIYLKSTASQPTGHQKNKNQTLFDFKVARLRKGSCEKKTVL